MSSASSSSSTDVKFPASNPLFSLHKHARSANKSYPSRQAVPDEKVPWTVEWKEYNPPDFTAEGVLKKSSDPSDASKIPNLANRSSYEMSPLAIDPSNGRALNPYGRTGLSGRGKLYNHGPNHAADPLLTRCSPFDPEELEVVVIQRGDTATWALPGGMVDPGEQPEETLKREFQEEAMDSTSKKHDQSKKDAISAMAQKVFSSPATDGEVVYKGYIDDPRNTDNAWIESYAMHYHLSPARADELSPFLQAGDDAKQVRWLLCNAEKEKDFQQLYASHRPIIELAVKLWKGKNKKDKQR